MIPLSTTEMAARWGYVTAAYGLSWGALTLYVASVVIRLWKER